MPYGVSDAAWAQMTYQDQLHAQRRVENARQGAGDYGSVEAAKQANMAQWGSAGSSSIVQPTEAGAGAWAPGGQFYDQPAAASDPYAPDGGYSGGYGSDGGYGALAPPPRPKLAESPEWLAYLSALGLEQSQFEADIARQRGIAGAETIRQIGELGPQYQIQRRNISGRMEDRGMVRSGEFLRRLSENRATQGRQEAGIQAGLTQQLSSLESQLAQKMTDIGARRADRELQLRSAGYV